MEKLKKCQKCINHFSWIKVKMPDLVFHYCKLKEGVLDVTGLPETEFMCECSNFKEDPSYIEK